MPALIYAAEADAPAAGFDTDEEENLPEEQEPTDLQVPEETAAEEPALSDDETGDDETGNDEAEEPDQAEQGIGDGSSEEDASSLPSSFFSESGEEEYPSDDESEPEAELLPGESSDIVMFSENLADEQTEADSLFSSYIEEQLYGGMAAANADYGLQYYAGSPFILKLYRELKSSVTQLAANGGSTKLSITYTLSADDGYTAEELEAVRTSAKAPSAAFPQKEFIRTLLYDCPLEFYWFDKTKGWRYGFDAFYNDDETELKIVWKYWFSVVSSYRSDSKNEYAVTEDVQKVERAVTEARSVAELHYSESDREKLTSYKNYICDATSYNSDASNGEVTYGDPWQLLYVFDGDPSTKVVCEGYAKAFQYLCDLSVFDDTDVYTVMGTIGTELHMWNIACIEGINYMIDVTNSDIGTAGSDGSLFLVTGVGDASGYNIPVHSMTISYTYDSLTCSIYTPEMLTLASVRGTETPVPKAPSVLHVSAPDPIMLTGSSMMLTAETEDGETRAEDGSTILHFSSSDESVITVSEEGLLTAVNPGNAVITVSLPERAAYEAAEASVEILSVSRLFTDVSDPSKFYYLPVYQALASGITSGITDTAFMPDMTCTRGQIVTFLYRRAGSPETDLSSLPFRDVQKSSPFAAAICWAYENGITSGTAADLFSPDAFCTRAQIITFLYRSLGSPEVHTECSFTDVSSSSVFYPAVCWACENGIASGTTATAFSPDAPCTRGQALSFLFRAA
ncbi:MAG: S-layer homology domain-containing protein [Lachnospiraceae bacterium]|nr:S-layer homology domain-containing protein [Lachnospiraceae bacterium]